AARRHAGENRGEHEEESEKTGSFHNGLVDETGSAQIHSLETRWKICLLSGLTFTPMHAFFKSLLALVFILAGIARAAEKPLVVGMELAYPPFEMRDERGEPAGVSVDLARALGQHLGRQIELQNLPFDGLIPALKTGR